MEQRLPFVVDFGKVFDPCTGLDQVGVLFVVVNDAVPLQDVNSIHREVQQVGGV